MKKTTLEKEKKVLEDSAAEKEVLLHQKIRTIGNYVHESVPVSDNEVRSTHEFVAIQRRITHPS